MARTIEIKTIGMERLDNSLHVRYHSQIYGIVKRFDVTKIGLTTALMDEWDGDIKVEQDINKEAQMNVNTKLMQKKDEERDKLVTFIFNAVRNYRLSPETNEAEAATLLYTLIRSYEGLQQKAGDRESSDIEGLVMDLRNAVYAPHVTTLRLTSAVNKLEAVSKEFDAYAAKRTQDRTASAKLPTARVARPKTDEVFDHILFVLKHAYSFGVAPVEKDLIAEMVAEMNTRTAEIEDVYRQSLALKKAAAKKKPKDPKQPKDPKDPKQPGGGDDIHLPEEPPKKPDEEQPKPTPGDGSGDDIHIPSEPPKKPDGVA